MIAAKMTKRKKKLCAPSHRHELRSFSSPVFRLERQFTRSKIKKTRRIDPTAVDHGYQQCCNVQENGTPLRNPSNKGGPTGKSAPPTLLTTNIKNAMCIGAIRPRFIVIHGRISRSEAAIVPIRFPSSAPARRKRVFRRGLLGARDRR